MPYPHLETPSSATGGEVFRARGHDRELTAWLSAQRRLAGAWLGTPVPASPRVARPLLPRIRRTRALMARSAPGPAWPDMLLLQRDQSPVTAGVVDVATLIAKVDLAAIADNIVDTDLSPDGDRVALWMAVPGGDGADTTHLVIADVISGAIVLGPVLAGQGILAWMPNRGGVLYEHPLDDCSALHLRTFEPEAEELSVFETSGGSEITGVDVTDTGTVYLTTANDAGAELWSGSVSDSESFELVIGDLDSSAEAWVIDGTSTLALLETGDNARSLCTLDLNDPDAEFEDIITEWPEALSNDEAPVPTFVDAVTAGDLVAAVWESGPEHLLTVHDLTGALVRTVGVPTGGVISFVVSAAGEDATIWLGFEAPATLPRLCRLGLRSGEIEMDVDPFIPPPPGVTHTWQRVHDDADGDADMDVFFRGDVSPASFAVVIGCGTGGIAALGYDSLVERIVATGGVAVLANPGDDACSAHADFLQPARALVEAGLVPAGRVAIVGVSSAVLEAITEDPGAFSAAVALSPSQWLWRQHDLGHDVDMSLEDYETAGAERWTRITERVRRSCDSPPLLMITSRAGAPVDAAYQFETCLALQTQRSEASTPVLLLEAEDPRQFVDGMVLSHLQRALGVNLGAPAAPDLATGSPGVDLAS